MEYWQLDGESRLCDARVMDDHLTRFALLCGQCSCGCPELFVDHDAAPEKAIVITDDFGQRVQMSADQFAVLIEQARSGQLDQAVAELVAS